MILALLLPLATSFSALVALSPLLGPVALVLNVLILLALHCLLFKFAKATSFDTQWILDDGQPTSNPDHEGETKDATIPHNDPRLDDVLQQVNRFMQTQGNQAAEIEMLRTKVGEQQKVIDALTASADKHNSGLLRLNQKTQNLARDKITFGKKFEGSIHEQTKLREHLDALTNFGNGVYAHMDQQNRDRVALCMDLRNIFGHDGDFQSLTQHLPVEAAEAERFTVGAIIAIVKILLAHGNIITELTQPAQQFSFGGPNSSSSTSGASLDFAFRSASQPEDISFPASKPSATGSANMSNRRKRQVHGFARKVDRFHR